MISLEDYVDRMKDDQKAIYYINGPSRDAIEGVVGYLFLIGDRLELWSCPHHSI